MMKSRGVAVIGAFLLIALAIFLRGLIADGDGGGSDGPKKGNDGGLPVVACTPDLAEICDALADGGEIAADPPDLDLDGAAAPDPEIDGWITWDPAPEIADFDAGQNEVWGDSEVLGSARLAMLVDPATTEVLVDECDATTVWACVAAAPAAGLSVGVGDPTTAEGLSRLQPLAVALAPDLDPEALEANELRDIVTSATSQGDAATMSLSATQPGVISIVVGPEAVLDRIAGSAQGRNRRLSTSVATPKTTVSVVVAPRTGGDLDDPGDLVDACEDDAVDQALRQAGVIPCSDDRAELEVLDQAGFLYTVREKAI